MIKIMNYTLSFQIIVIILFSKGVSFLKKSNEILIQFLVLSFRGLDFSIYTV